MTDDPVLQTGNSFDGAHRSVSVSHSGWWRRMLAFVGPAYMVSVGYMDPGNWATDIAGGAQFGYRLIWVLLMSNVMAVLLQTLSARLGLVAGRDLAQACRDAYPVPVRYVLFVLCEIAICACDLAELLGTAIGLNLLFGIPLIWAVVITGSDVLILLLMQHFGVRKLEAFIVLLISTIGLCFIVEIFLCKPSASGIASGFIPGPLSGDALYVAIGIIGATVMPHNLYLHSSLVQSRDVHRSVDGVVQACRYNLIDSVVALNGAFFVNAAILIVAAATFWSRGIVVTEIQQAHQLLDSVLGSRLAPVAFALALICAGQSSTVTGTLAGQITMEGFLQFRLRPSVRRLITRLIGIVPAVAVIWVMGDRGTYKLLIRSQVILSLQLPFAVVPLVKFTNSRTKMGPFANPRVVQAIAWLVTGVIISLNAKLVYEEIGTWAAAAGSWRWLVTWATGPLAAAMGGLLVWMIAQRERPVGPAPSVSADAVVEAAVGQRFERIGVALDASPGDGAMLAEALAFAGAHRAELVLMHIVEGVGGQWYGPQTGDFESRHDDAYLTALTDRLKREISERGIRDVRSILGYGDVAKELVRLAQEQKIDLMVMGSHGHGPLSDWLLGQTIPGVRHGLGIPILTVKRGTAKGPAAP
jgi:manganese transport protein